MLYDSFSSPPPAPRLIKLFSSEVEPHYFSTTWESLYPIPWEVFTPLSLDSKESWSLVLISPCSWQACNDSPAMSCGGWFLHSLYNCEPLRNKHFSYRLNESRLSHVSHSACVASLHLQTAFELIRTVTPLS